MGLGVERGNCGLLEGGKEEIKIKIRIRIKIKNGGPKKALPDSRGMREGFA